MTSCECYENKWFHMKYIGKMAETESLLSTCCISLFISKYILCYEKKSLNSDDHQFHQYQQKSPLTFNSLKQKDHVIGN